MEVFTLNVGQGQFVVVTGESEAFIIDTFVPLNPSQPIIHIKSALADILSGKNLIGLIITGFDADHFNEIGMKIVLNKYRPNWIMYPKYFKPSKTADSCFAAIKSFEQQKAITKYSISLDKNDTRFYNKLSNEFIFEIFSPHSADMNSSNNCSLVCKVKERSTGATYLITGDTENDRWDSIVRFFGNSISCDVLSAPHHGSKNGITNEAIELISPTTVLISAGVDNGYGHPDKEAIALFETETDDIYSTNDEGGRSLRTSILKTVVNTYRYETQ